MKYLTKATLRAAGRAIIATVRSYKSDGAPRSERGLDPVLYAYLLACGLDVRRQTQVRVKGKKVRIDFETRGSNPAFIEWAVRPPMGGRQLSGAPNAKELEKLSRIPNVRKRTGQYRHASRSRYLLLVDLTIGASQQLLIDPTQAEYKAVRLGPGKFVRESVTVVYEHEAASFSFRWKAK